MHRDSGRVQKTTRTHLPYRPLLLQYAISVRRRTRGASSASDYFCSSERVGGPEVPFVAGGQRLHYNSGRLSQLGQGLEEQSSLVYLEQDLRVSASRN